MKKLILFTLMLCSLLGLMALCASALLHQSTAPTFPLQENEEFPIHLTEFGKQMADFWARSEKNISEAQLAELQLAAAEKQRAAFQALEPDFAALAKQDGITGMSLSILHKGQVAYTYHYGLAKLDPAQPVTDDTNYRVASISKLIHQIPLMTLVDQGKLDLDEDISTYLGYKVRNPRYPSTPITTRNLMTHTGTFLDSATFLSVYRIYQPISLSTLLKPRGANYSTTHFSRRKPGLPASFQYSNFGAGVSGAVLERITGTTLPHYVAEVFAPLELDSGFSTAQLADKNNLSSLFQKGRQSWSLSVMERYEKGLAAVPIGEHFTNTPGDFMGTSRDVAKILSILVNGGKYGDAQIVSEKAIADMHSMDGGYPRGQNTKIFPDLVAGRTLYGHTGSANGFYGQAVYDLSDQSGVVILCNSGSGAKDVSSDSLLLAKEIVNAIYRAME